MFDISGIIPLELTAKTFNKMTRIRFLKFHSSNGMSIPIGFESISTKIRYFHWKGYPGKSLPSNFCTQLLLELNLKESMVETLWDGVQDLANLRRLILQKCHNLRELPDFSKACSLESVDLSHCNRLSDVHASLLSLQCLISLDLSYCSDLRSFKMMTHSKYFREREVLDCKNLKKFLVLSEELTSLNLFKTLIEEWSPSIGRCSKPIQALSCLTFLVVLSVSNLQNIDNVSVGTLFDRLRSLQSLSLIKCCNLTELPDNITQLSCLKLLALKWCSDLTKLPVSMRSLSKLQYLSVEGCTALRSLPELPPSLEKLIATDCTSLETEHFNDFKHTLE
ncbi:hypothetical protein QN277_022370 [Acacia crassicarpa]|uniref:Uncharacterized protein n=1 Tax=Acacia crassicarpa TaxID=499986 RepID=A0AAE1JGP4_9FABA|nr:hypothetical protein QN277_022370 [Acacia crassicarpa]